MAERFTARQRRVARLRAHFGWVGATCVRQPALVLLSGLPGTGKSHLAAMIAERHSVAVLRSDEVRKALFPVPQYTGTENGNVYLSCYALLEALLADGYAVVFDATNLLRRGRRRAQKIAERAGAPVLMFVTTAPPEVVAERLHKREQGESAAFSSDAGWAVHQKLAATVDTVSEPALVIDTAGSLEPALDAVNAVLNEARAKAATTEAAHTHEGAA